MFGCLCRVSRLLGVQNCISPSTGTLIGNPQFSVMTEKPVWIDPNQQEKANRAKSQHTHGFNVVTSVCETLSTWTTVQIPHTYVHKCSCQFLCYNTAKPTPVFNLFGITPTLVRRHCDHCSSFLCTTPRELLQCLMLLGDEFPPVA